MDDQKCSVARAIWNGIEPACCVRENIWFFLDTYWTSYAPASAQKISMGRVMRLHSSAGPYYPKKSCCVRLASLLSQSFGLEDDGAILMLMGVLMEAACQVRCTVCLVPGLSGRYPFLLLCPPEQQITFHSYRDRLSWPIGSLLVGLLKAKKTCLPVKIEGLSQIENSASNRILNI